MSATKKINVGNYTISTMPDEGNPLGEVFVKTHKMTVTGIFVTDGNIVPIASISPTLKFNANLNPTDPPLLVDSGIEVIRGTQPNIALLWHEIGGGSPYQGQWTVSNAAGHTSTILTSGNIQIEKSTPNPPYLAGNVVVTGYNAGTGQSGLYINEGSSNGELVTVKAARKYALIFG